jgi:hypothetical protein
MKAATAAELQKIGLQLYTVRDLLNSDLKGPYRKLRCSGIERWSLPVSWSLTSSRPRNVLRRLGLTAPSLHIEYANLWKKAEATRAGGELLRDDPEQAPN